MSPTMQNVLILFAAFSGMPIFAAMICLQFLITMIVIVILVAMKASEKVIAYVSIFAFLAMGFAIVVTPAGVITLIIEGVLSIVAFAVHNGYALQAPTYIEARSISDDGTRVSIGVRHGTRIAKGEFLPDAKHTLEGAAEVAESLAHNSRRQRMLPKEPETVYYQDES